MDAERSAIAADVSILGDSPPISPIPMGAFDADSDDDDRDDDVDGTSVTLDGNEFVSNSDGNDTASGSEDDDVVTFGVGRAAASAIAAAAVPPPVRVPSAAVPLGVRPPAAVPSVVRPAIPRSIGSSGSSVISPVRQVRKPVRGGMSGKASRVPVAAPSALPKDKKRVSRVPHKLGMVSEADIGYMAQELSSPIVDEQRNQAFTGGAGKMEYALAASVIVLDIPNSYKEAMASPQAAEWQGAIEKELGSMEIHNTWKIVPLPQGHRAMSCKWVFTIKRDENGDILRYKARIVARGFDQPEGTYGETFAPVLHYKSLRVQMAIVASLDYELLQMDVPTAFLNATLTDELYMKVPLGCPNAPDGHVCRLIKSLYGIKQAPREWNDDLNRAIVALGWIRCSADSCMYVKKSYTRRMMLLPVFVDDIFPACHRKDRAELISDMKKLMEKYGIPTIEDAKMVLGMRITRDRMRRTLYLDQELYITRLLEQYGMVDCATARTPEVTIRSYDGESEKKAKLRMRMDEEEEWSVGGTYPQYGSLVGALLYAALSTRPDIAHATSMLTRSLRNPTRENWIAGKRVLRYLRGTARDGITFGGGVETEKVLIDSSFCDADWAGDREGRRSTTGYLMKINGGIVSWSSKKQGCVAISSAEAEYLAAGAAVQEILWLRTLLKEMGFEQPGGTILQCDNKPAIAIASDDRHHPRTKHIDLKHHFIRDHVRAGRIVIRWIGTANQEADILTKALGDAMYTGMRNKMMGGEAKEYKKK